MGDGALCYGALEIVGLLLLLLLFIIIVIQVFIPVGLKVKTQCFKRTGMNTWMIINIRGIVWKLYKNHFQKIDLARTFRNYSTCAVCTHLCTFIRCLVYLHVAFRLAKCLWLSTVLHWIWQKILQLYLAVAPTVWNDLPLDTRLSPRWSAVSRQSSSHIPCSAAHIATAGASDSALLLTLCALQ